MSARAGLRPENSQRAILVGDLNVAPLEHDVWSHKQMIKVVSHTPVECEKLLAAQKAGGWIDCMRVHTPEPEKLYTWWSYRAMDNWRAADRGRRLDHVWTSDALADRVSAIRHRQGLPRRQAPLRPRAGDGDNRALIEVGCKHLVLFAGLEHSLHTCQLCRPGLQALGHAFAQLLRGGRIALQHLAEQIA